MSRLSDFSKLIRSKKNLLQCVFTTLIIQVIVTSLVIFFLQKNPTIFSIMNKNVYLILSFLICLFLIYFMSYGKISFYTRFLLFTVFSIIQGIFLHSITIYIPNEMIISSLISTIAIFIMFVIAGFVIVFFKLNISLLGVVLFFSLLLLIITNIVFIFIPPSDTSKRILTSISILIFSMYILYDTFNITVKYQNTKVDCIRGSLDYYLDLINLFLSLLDKS